MFNAHKKTERYRIIVCVGITVLIAVFVYNRYSLFFNQDDIGMRNIVSGLTTGEPDAHTYFIFYPVSVILSTLYSLFPRVYWYLVFFLFCNYTCLFLVLYRVMQKVGEKSHILLVMVTLLYIILWIRQFIELEWTTTAGILSACAIFWYGTIPNAISKMRRIIEYGISLILLATAFNIRYTVVLMLAPIAAVVVAFKWGLNLRAWKRVNTVSEIVFCFLAVIIVVGSFGINRLYYSGEKWEERRDFSQYRADLFDYYGYPEYEEYEELYDEAGITKEMLACLSEDGNFMLAATGVLEAEDLRPLAEKSIELYKARMNLKEQVLSSVRMRWDRAWGENYRIYSFIFYVGIALTIVIAIVDKKWFQLFLSVFLVVIFESLWVYLYYKGRLPVRVGYSLCVGGIAAVMSMLWREQKIERLIRIGGGQIIAMFCIAVIFGQTMSNIEIENDADEQLSQIKRDTKQYCENNNQNLYLRDLYSFWLSCERIQDRDERLGVNYRPYNDWTCGMPLKCPYMPLDGSRELCSWIAEQENVYLLVDIERAEGVTKRQEDLFISRNIKCDLVLSDEIYIENGKVIQVYKYECEK